MNTRHPLEPSQDGQPQNEKHSAPALSPLSPEHAQPQQPNSDHLTNATDEGSTRLPPEGFRLLPVEATDAMMDADWDVSMSDAHSNGGVSAAAWRAMVEAAPVVTYGNGHSGPGWYMHDAEYPEEGAVFLGAAPRLAVAGDQRSDVRTPAVVAEHADLLGEARELLEKIPLPPGWAPDVGELLARIDTVLNRPAQEPR